MITQGRREEREYEKEKLTQPGISYCLLNGRGGRIG